MKNILIKQCKMKKTSYSSHGNINASIKLKGVAKVNVSSMLKSIEQHIISYLLEDIKDDGDDYYISEKDDNVTLVSIRHMPHGSDLESDCKVLNPDEIELYKSLRTLSNFFQKI